MTPLAFRDSGLRWDEAARRIVALGDRAHARLGVLDEWVPDFSIRLLEAPRRAEPRRYGVPTEAADWYVDGDEGPDPYAFHLALASLESMLWDTPEVSLVGVGQGASLCLSLACCWPERLVAVIAREGTLPCFPPGAVAERPMEGLPVLCVGAAAASASELARRGASVEVWLDWDAAAGRAWLLRAAGPADEPAGQHPGTAAAPLGGGEAERPLPAGQALHSAARRRVSTSR